MNDTETLKEVCALGGIAAVFAIFIFGIGSRSLPSGFHVFPSSTQAWIAFWFHTLELLVCCCFIVAWHPGYYRFPSSVATPIAYLALSLPPLLLLSAIVFWRRGRPFSRVGLIWSGVAVLTFYLTPAIPITKAV